MKTIKTKLYYILLSVILLGLLPVNSFAQWDWQTCNNWSYKIYNHYMVRNNIWGINNDGAGSQCLNVNSESNWHISATHQNGNGRVKGYPQMVRGWVQGGIGNTYPDGSPSPLVTNDHGIGMRIDELTKFDIHHNTSLPATGRYMTLYDMYMFYDEFPGLPYEENKPDNLVMLFTAMQDNTGWMYSDASQHPIHTIGDRQWRIRPPQPSSIVNENNYILYPYPDWIIEEATIDYLEILHYLRDNFGLPESLRISTIQKGIEIIDGGQYTINDFWVDISVDDDPTPPSVVTIPAKIQAEDWTSMSGVQTQPTSDEGGGLNVGWITQGDWMDYTINVPTSGTYTVDFRLASPNSGRQLQLREGSTTLATVDIPNTGGWQNWQTVSTTVNLSAGDNKTLRVLASNGDGWNFNWFEVKSGSSTSYNLTVNNGSGSGSYTEGTVVNITANAAPAGQQFAQWTGDVANVANVNSASTTLTMPSSNTTITATYDDIPDGAVQAGITSSSAGAEQAGNPKENAYDGNESSRWANDGTVGNAWIEFNLDGNYALENVEILFFNGNSRTYPLNIELNGSSIWSGSTSTTSGYWTQALSGTGDVLRISMTGNNSDGSGWFSIHEIKINGTPVSPQLYTLTVNNGSGSGNYLQGTTVNITADTAPSGQQFAQWTGDVANVADINSASTTITMPASAVTLTASFEDIPDDPVQAVIISSSAGSEQAGNPKENAYDGNESSRWANDANNDLLADAWIEFNLDDTYDLHNIEILFFNGNSRTFPLNIELNGSSIWSGNTSTTSGYWTQSLSGTGNLLRISMIGNNSDGTEWFSIYEVRINGIPVGQKSALAPTSIAEKSLENVSIFPNPVKNGLLNINLVDLNNAEAQIYDVMGRFILSAKLTQSSNTLNVDKLKKGVYILKLNSNHETIALRLVIE